MISTLNDNQATLLLIELKKYTSALPFPLAKAPGRQQMFLFTNGKVPGQTSLALERLKSGPQALSR